MKPEPMFTVKTWMCETEEKGLNGSRSFWSSGHSDHALARGFWRLASPRLRLGIVASLLSDSIVSQHIVWLVYTVRWEQWISSTVGSIRSDNESTFSLQFMLLELLSPVLEHQPVNDKITLQPYYTVSFNLIDLKKTQLASYASQLSAAKKSSK